VCTKILRYTSYIHLNVLFTNICKTQKNVFYRISIKTLLSDVQKKVADKETVSSLRAPPQYGPYKNKHDIQKTRHEQLRKKLLLYITFY